jgi:two-component system NtrC family sensor kinase
LLKDQSNAEGANRVKKLEEVVQESIQGAEQIRNIVQIFKNSGLTTTANRTLLNVHAILNSAIAMASFEAKHKNVTIEKKFLANIPLIESNSGLLHQLFLNLLINAYQSIAEKNKKHNKISIRTFLKSSKLRVDIEDTGSGISPDLLPHIFEPFISTKQNGENSGLGLSICQEILHNLGGKIKVHSELGKGSLFSIYLPIKQ